MPPTHSTTAPVTAPPAAQAVRHAAPVGPAAEYVAEVAPRVKRPFEGPAKWAAFVVLVLAAAAIGAWALSHPRPAMHLTSAPQPLSVPMAPTAAEEPAAPAPPVAAPEPVATPEPIATPKVEAPTPAPEPARPSPVAAAVARMNVNTATQAQLELLPGVGPALAQRIIADREKNGRYTAIEQLDRVKGIGPKTIEKLRPHIRLD